jgi:16S rRNA (uracil1498-N3)-methyltransferase
MRSPAEATPGLVYVPDLQSAGATVTLSAPESHYVGRVCRARAGDRVTATDGRGRIANLRIAGVGARVSARVEVVDERERARRAWVLGGAPEGRRADWLVEKLAELGVERWQPLECERAGWGHQAGRAARWRRIAIAAMKQSRAAFLLEIADPLPLAQALRQLPTGATRWLARRDGAALPGAPVSGLSVAAVGPAAGFVSDEERAMVAEGFVPVRLAESRLRAETAALAWAAWWAGGAGQPSA